MYHSTPFVLKKEAHSPMGYRPSGLSLTQWTHGFTDPLGAQMRMRIITHWVGESLGSRRGGGVGPRAIGSRLRRHREQFKIFST